LTSVTSDLPARLQSAASRLQQGRPSEAAAILRDAAALWPRSADARRLLGLALRDMGDLMSAETDLRAALALDPRSGPTAVALSEVCLALGRPQEALAPLAALATNPWADLNILSAYGDVLRAVGRRDDAISVLRRAARENPRSGVAAHNLASALGDAERFAEAVSAARDAFARGLDAPETWLVLGRAFIGQGQHDEAERALREAIRRRPDYVDAHGELAQLLWMMTADAKRACAPLDLAIAAYPGHQPLALRKSELLDFAGDHVGALEALAPFLSRGDVDPVLHVVAARLIARTDPARAVDHARLAVRSRPDDYIAQSALTEALLAAGDAKAAGVLAERLRARMPDNQHALGILFTAWRLAGDPRYAEFSDYAAAVGTDLLDTPPGWSRLDDFLADLARALAPLHSRLTHPIGQSVRHGSQTSQSLELSSDPVIKAFFKAVDGPIRRRMANLTKGPDILVGRKTADYAFNGVWSVRLQPNGFHANHLHPKGWLSSACYVALPAAIARGREGWLKFGEPGVPTLPALEPEHYVKPEPGLLALFPSYMWHGTVPFGGDEPRLTIAFDLVPARG
jgi:tetratricopeptide (TPR) repeat protein